MNDENKLIRLADALAAAPHCCACDWADAIAALPAAQVAVKPLIFTEARNHMWNAQHGYRIGWNRDDFFRVKLVDRVICKRVKGFSNAVAWANTHNAARIRAALDVGPAHLSARFDADEWHGVLMWTDDGEKTLFDWCTGGGDPDGEFSRVGLRRETSDGRVLYRTYTANGPWGDPAPMLDVAPAPDVARLVEALRDIERHSSCRLSRSAARAALAEWEDRNE